jgi:hypothetical protein
MRTILTTTLLIILISLPVLAQQPTLQDSLLDRMTGSWFLQGKIAGKETVHDIKADWVLGHQFVLIQETSREKNVDGRPAYEANVYIGWDQPAGEYICIWLDVWGGWTPQTIGRTKPCGNEFPFLFRDKNDSVVFHTTFSYDKNTDTWKWVMDNDEGGKLQPFARVKLTKK